MFSYNFRNGYALLTYMEYPIILFQELILIYCVIHYKGLLGLYSFIGAVIYFSLAAGFLLGILPREFLTFLVVCIVSTLNSGYTRYSFSEGLCLDMLLIR